MSAWKEMMTQEEAMNMSNEQAVQILIPMRNMMCDQNGCPISDAVFALDKAIEEYDKMPGKRAILAFGSLSYLGMLTDEVKNRIGER